MGLRRPPLPKREPPRTPTGRQDWIPPEELEGALRSLYRSYERTYAHWETELAAARRAAAGLHRRLPQHRRLQAGLRLDRRREVELEDGEITRSPPGNLPLLSNVDDGVWTRRQRTILVDSAQLESGEPLEDDFKKDAAREIEAFKQEYRLRNPGADVDKLTDEDLLREVMNTVGKKGKLGEHVRCVVSVSMLTEGWDANTVTHILGIRPFGSQLLCEQVVGRGLRRRSYAVNDDGHFEPEYANVYGIPVRVHLQRQADRRSPRPPAGDRGASPRRARGDLRIALPQARRLPGRAARRAAAPTSTTRRISTSTRHWSRSGSRTGASSARRRSSTSTTSATARPQQVAFALAKTLVDRDDASPPRRRRSGRGSSRSWSTSAGTGSTHA